jgi:ribosomal protein S6--L-glutamate ligase
MIVSFHPCIVADVNRLCAGRNPDGSDLAAIREADAVILPQGCQKELYEMARSACLRVFPNYDVRFSYPGKTGQIRLFSEYGAPHPRSVVYADTCHCHQATESEGRLPFYPPFVLKLDYGGEGETVYHVKNETEWNDLIQDLRRFESGSQAGFILQEYVPAGDRSLRVVVIGSRYLSYWRIHPESGGFYTCVSKGAALDPDAHPGLQRNAVDTVRLFCQQTGINLAGFDILFPLDNTQKTSNPEPLFLEINYFFGRQGLGGSEAYYVLLMDEINKWLRDAGLNHETVCL